MKVKRINGGLAWIYSHRLQKDLYLELQGQKSWGKSQIHKQLWLRYWPSGCAYSTKSASWWPNICNTYKEEKCLLIVIAKMPNITQKGCARYKMKLKITNGELTWIYSCRLQNDLYLELWGWKPWGKHKSTTNDRFMIHFC